MIEDKFIEGLDENKLWAKIMWNISDFVHIWISRIFIRGKCALFGCDENYNTGGGGYLPDDCTEWWCNRCWAEGINAQVRTFSFFYKEDKIRYKMRNFIQALRGG